jgi:hypothetical protein
LPAPPAVALIYNHGAGVEIDCGPGPRVLVVGGSVANGWGASSMDREWWVLACHELGGTWRNEGAPAAHTEQETKQLERAVGFGANVVIEMTGANDMIHGLAPMIRGQFGARVERFWRNHERIRALAGDHLLTVLQPIPLGAPTWETRGFEPQIREAYAAMGVVADLRLEVAPVDYLDAYHFGDHGHELVADAVVRAVRARDAATRREEG